MLASLERIVVASLPPILVTACAAPAVPVRVEPTLDRPAATAFAELTSLVGSWEGRASNGRTSRVAYRISAGDSVLVETWTQSNGREALTIYHVDDGELMATHDCPKGNRVLLRWTGAPSSEGHDFEFVHGANLGAAARSHQREFRIDLAPDGTFARGETYVRNASTPAEIAAQPLGERITYRRIGSTG